MKLKRIIHGVLLVLGLSVLGLLFYYAMWLITDEDFREMLKYGWPSEQQRQQCRLSRSCRIS